MGDVACQLFYKKVPVTVGNFVALADGTKEWTDPTTGEKTSRPLYDGTKFHRVIKDFMVQGGDPLGTGMGGPGYKFMDEFDPSLRLDGPGVLAMANAGPGTNGSQFFITHKATPWLNDKHTVFGHVVYGQDVVNAMGDVDMTGAQHSTPVKDIILKHVSIIRHGADAKAFDENAAFAKAEEIAKAKAAEAAKRAEEFKKSLDADLPNAVTTDDGLKYIVKKEGDGAQPKVGDTIVAHYTGYLMDGTKFDSSVDRGQPFRTPIGVNRVIKGWDEAFLGMKEGEKRRLIIPPDLGYGPQGAGGVIPPNATLVFDVELLQVIPKGN
jgi:peptidylprolyl isomerase